MHAQTPTNMCYFTNGFVRVTLTFSNLGVSSFALICSLGELLGLPTSLPFNLASLLSGDAGGDFGCKEKTIITTRPKNLLLMGYK